MIVPLSAMVREWFLLTDIRIETRETADSYVISHHIGPREVFIIEEIALVHHVVIGFRDTSMVPVFRHEEKVGSQYPGNRWLSKCKPDENHYWTYGEMADYLTNRFQELIQEVTLDRNTKFTPYILGRLCQIRNKEEFLTTIGQLLSSRRLILEEPYLPLITEIAGYHGISKNEMYERYVQLQHSLFAANNLIA